jgi:hypothetical protein
MMLPDHAILQTTFPAVVFGVGTKMPPMTSARLD